MRGSASQSRLPMVLSVGSGRRRAGSFDVLDESPRSIPGQRSLSPTVRNDGVQAEVELDAAHMAGLAVTNGPADDLNGLRGSMAMVAGVGFEPTTFRL